ncbi:MAG: heavy-metal-associated domain-containing protein [Bacteroidota bacterium]
MKRIFSIVIFLAFLNVANAQIKSANLQASGLTCSMCSRAIFKAIKTLEFVDKVEANIKNSSFDITFKPGTKIDLDMIKNKVEGAGFFVAAFSAKINFDGQLIKNDGHTTIDKNVFHFLNVKDQSLTGEHTIKILDKGFVTAKEYKKNSKYTSMECYKTGVAGACCAKHGLAKGTRIFHVTI